LTKAQREKIALEKRAKEVEEKQRLKDEDRQTSNGSTSSFSSSSYTNGSNGRYSSSNGPPLGPKGYRDPPSAPASMRPGQSGRNNNSSNNSRSNGTSSNYSNGNGMPPPPPISDKRPAEESAEAKVIRLRYMGADPDSNSLNKKKRRKTSERKFTFEWGADEDTSQDYNPLYSQRAEAKFFGRGKLGGFAENDKSTLQYAKALEGRGDTEERRRARELIEMDRKKRENLNWSDKHWSEKPLEVMKERDWRIFKEDFNISTKGVYLSYILKSLLCLRC